MITLSDIKVSSFEISLVKLTGLKIEDIHGYLTTEFGEPVFKLTNVVLEGGKELGCEGEHDLPYLVSWRDELDPPNMDYETLEQLYDEGE